MATNKLSTKKLVAQKLDWVLADVGKIMRILPCLRIVNRFWKIFYCWKQQSTVYKINIKFLVISWKPRCTTVWNIEV